MVALPTLVADQHPGSLGKHSVMTSRLALSFHAHKTGAYKHSKLVSFQIYLCSNPHLWSWIWGQKYKRQR